MRENRSTGMAWARTREKKRKKKSHYVYMSPPPGGATADQIRTKLGSVGGPLDVITHTCFELNRLRAVSVAWGSI